jgi:hypothetical protein
VLASPDEVDKNENVVEDKVINEGNVVTLVGEVIDAVYTNVPQDPTLSVNGVNV